MTVSVLVAGLGNMGRSHALAYHDHPGFEVIGLVNRSRPDLDPALASYPVFGDYAMALRQLKPALVSINTYTDTHADYAILALEQGAHVFIEKPLALTVADAQRVVAAAKANGRKLVVGYILRHHPSWMRFVDEARKLGGPYAFRLNLNQQSSGKSWEIHKRLMQTTSPLVDCGVHYVDVMCQITDAKPIEVRGMGVRLSDEVAPDMYNYGALQVLFEDGSRGWFESAFGPMVSEMAYFTKDVMTPNGSVSIVTDAGGRSDSMEAHTRTSRIRVHHAALGADGTFVQPDTFHSTADEPDHQALCAREQDFVYRAITEDIDLSRHMQDAVESLRVCLAADESIRTGLPVKL
jgi:predicted dehydrogenase